MAWTLRDGDLRLLARQSINADWVNADVAQDVGVKAFRRQESVCCGEPEQLAGCCQQGLGRSAVHVERCDIPMPKLGAFVAQLDAMLEANEKRGKRDRFRLTRIFDDLRREGYEGGYDAVRRYAQRWRRERHVGVSQAFVTLCFAPGEAFQFDWSHEWVVMDGVTTKVKVAHIRLCYSRMRFLVAYPRVTQEMVFDAHDRAFAFFGGACTRGIYDNMSTAVDAILVGKERRFNRGFLRMCSHHLVEPTACSPAAGWEKGQVENQVKTSREGLFTPRLRVANYDDLNMILHERAIAQAARTRHPEPKDKTILDVFEEERAVLVPWQGAHRQLGLAPLCQGQRQGLRG